jgi:two-component system, chemotaxis family, chemotaxis protein CheY
MSIRILIADDSAFWRTELKEILEEQSDWVVFEAKDGFEALQKANWVHPDLVILDLSMPELDGLQAARELKRRTPQLPVLIITVDKSSFLEVLARQAGIEAVFSKVECPLMRNFVERMVHERAA